MKKKHDFTDEMLSMLHEGDTFKSFAELSRKFDVFDENGKPLSGTAKKRFLQEMDRWVEFSKDGQKITIVKIRSEREVKPQVPTKRKQKYSPLIQNILAFQLLRYCEKHRFGSVEFICNGDRLYEACGFINKNFSFYGKVGKSAAYKSVVDQFRRISRSKFKEYLETALNAMQKNGELSWKYEPWLVKGPKQNRKYYPLLSSEKEWFYQIEKDTVHSMHRHHGPAYKTKQEVFAAKGKLFFDEVNKKVREEYSTKEEIEKDVDVRIERLYQIRLAPKNIKRLSIHDMQARSGSMYPDYDRLVEFTDLNRMICEYIKTSPKMKGNQTVAQPNPKRKIPENDLWGGENKMVPEFYFFKNRLKQEEIDELVKRIIEVHPRENDCDYTRIPEFLPIQCIRVNNVLDDDDAAYTAPVPTTPPQQPELPVQEDATEDDDSNWNEKRPDETEQEWKERIMAALLADSEKRRKASHSDDAEIELAQQEQAWDEEILDEVLKENERERKQEEKRKKKENSRDELIAGVPLSKMLEEI